MNKSKTKTAFVCNQCGQEYSRWQGKCTNCGVWESVVEFRVPAKHERAHHTALPGDAAIVALSACQPEKLVRVLSAMPEVDRVLGGGLVPGSLTLIGGEPGIGKSTLLLQLMAQWAGRGLSTLYVSGEESTDQVSLRAHRLGIHGAAVLFLSETNVGRICALLDEHKPQVVVIDSIQTMSCDDLESTPGTVSQVREAAAVLLRYAKANGTAILLVGHVTKDGTLAGPRVLEHMVDAVLSFEGDANYQYRILRTLKNRHGPSGELALFAMSDRGLSEVKNAADIFLQGGPEQQVGTAVVAVLEGTRVLVVELQALVNQTHFGLPQRVASGINPKRLALLTAVMERHGGIALGDHDIFFNVAGGLTISEPAVDLGIVAALFSSFRNKPLARLGFIGEVGLGSEIRSVNHMDTRIQELGRAGYKRVVVPKVRGAGSDWAGKKSGVELVQCGKVGEMFGVLFG
jgi:DNA repair protein RadA/Sms